MHPVQHTVLYQFEITFEKHVSKRYMLVCIRQKQGKVNNLSFSLPLKPLSQTGCAGWQGAGNDDVRNQRFIFYWSWNIEVEK